MPSRMPLLVTTLPRFHRPPPQTRRRGCPLLPAAAKADSDMARSLPPKPRTKHQTKKTNIKSATGQQSTITSRSRWAKYPSGLVLGAAEQRGSIQRIRGKSPLLSTSEAERAPEGVHAEVVLAGARETRSREGGRRHTARMERRQRRCDRPDGQQIGRCNTPCKSSGGSLARVGPESVLPCQPPSPMSSLPLFVATPRLPPSRPRF